MPCTFPVLYEGEHSIKIYPGIKENGISETRIIYPFYNFYQTSAILLPGEIDTIYPSVTYNTAAADFAWIEDFENWHTFCKADGVTSDSIVQITTSAFEGNGSGIVNITGTSYFGQSCSQFTLPKVGTDIFLELNYKCNTAFNVGILGYNGVSLDAQTIALTINPSENWKKIYVNLTNEVNEALTSTKFRIFFSMLKNNNMPSSYFYIDNVKLIYQHNLGNIFYIAFWSSQAGHFQTKQSRIWIMQVFCFYFVDLTSCLLKKIFLHFSNNFCGLTVNKPIQL